VIYEVRHRTTYSYEGLVTFARCVLRLTPLSTAAQTVAHSAVVLTPQPARRQTRIGPFGEQVVTVVIDQPHRKLVIEGNSRVDVHAPPIDVSADSPAWENIRTASFKNGRIDTGGPAAFLYPTARTPLLPAITDYARASFSPRRPILEAAVSLMDRMYADFTFDAEATTVRTPAAEAFAARRGVCQDFAHVMISALRGLGLPAAYVSGYLRTVPPPGRPRLEGSDATHAWVQLWCGEALGWIGLDPTNAILVRNDHIVLAVGRDYADVAPIDGVMLGSGEQALKVEVDVIPQDELAAPAAASRVGAGFLG
jgi:transglutaminase-like putative cysteine protease